MNGRNFRSWQTVVWVLLVAGILALALGGYLAPLSTAVLNPLVEVQTWVATRYNALADFFTTPQDVAELQRQNDALEAEVARLQAQVVELQQQNSEIQVLSALVDFARQNPANDYIAANVIGRDPSPFLQYVIINRGSDDGLRKGMPVVTSQGLVGRVSAVIASAARVQLISDPAMQINVRLQNSNTNAVLNGSLTGDVTLEQIPQEAAIQTGELILTSGLGGSYPSNILIGQVSGQTNLSFELFQSAAVQPIVDFSKLEIVLVISNFQPVNIAPLIP